jgi:small subunit ribosomal protein S8
LPGNGAWSADAGEKVNRLNENSELSAVLNGCCGDRKMTMSDPIADMLTRIRNAAKARFNSVDIPGSNLKTELAKIMKEEGFIRNYKFIKDGKQGILRVYLKYGPGQESVIYGLKRISKPSRRVYLGSGNIKSVMNGMGVAILSTSKGIMTDKRARAEKIGGEHICNLW